MQVILAHSMHLDDDRKSLVLEIVASDESSGRSSDVDLWDHSRDAVLVEPNRTQRFRCRLEEFARNLQRQPRSSHSARTVHQQPPDLLPGHPMIPQRL